jgi:hypothetical protein
MATKKQPATESPAESPTVFLRNVSPQGALMLPLTGGQSVASGAIVEIPRDRAQGLLSQDIWDEVDGPDPEPDPNADSSGDEPDPDQKNEE